MRCEAEVRGKGVCSVHTLTHTHTHTHSHTLSHTHRDIHRDTDRHTDTDTNRHPTLYHLLVLLPRERPIKTRRSRGRDRMLRYRFSTRPVHKLRIWISEGLTQAESQVEGVEFLGPEGVRLKSEIRDS